MSNTRKRTPAVEGFTEDLGRRPGQLIPAQPVQHPLAEPIFDTRSTAREILRVVTGEETTQGDGPKPIDILIEIVAKMDERLERVESKIDSLISASVSAGRTR